MSLQRIRAADEGVEMAQVTRASVSDIDVLATSWRLHLAAERKSAATITAYSYATTQLATFLREAGHAHQRRRDHIETFLVHVIETRSASTAETRYRGLRGFFGWPEEEGEIAASPMARIGRRRSPSSPSTFPHSMT
jgi:site-specific recombinase XerD